MQRAKTTLSRLSRTSALMRPVPSRNHACMFSARPSLVFFGLPDRGVPSVAVRAGLAVEFPEEEVIVVLKAVQARSQPELAVVLKMANEIAVVDGGTFICLLSHASYLSVHPTTAHARIHSQSHSNTWQEFLQTGLETMSNSALILVFFSSSAKLLHHVTDPEDPSEGRSIVVLTCT